MNFFNRYLLSYSGIALAATLLIYYLNITVAPMPTWLSVPVFLAYIALLVVSTFLIERRDPYQGYFGFNYNVVTYIICIACPFVLYKVGALADISFLPSMAIIWGVGIIVHLLICFILFRKRKIKSYDKRQIFQ